MILLLPVRELLLSLIKKTLMQLQKRVPETVAVLVLALVFAQTFAPRLAHAMSPDFPSVSRWFGAFPSITTSRDASPLPWAEDRVPDTTMRVPVTAYSSEPWQTDSTPFITASNTHVRRGVIAANFLPIGTRVRFPKLYGDEIFVVEDRMNQRYHKKIDIWMEETADARNFGLKHADIEVFYE